MGADVGCAFLPFVAGGGAIIRGATKIDDVVDGVKALDKGSDVLSTVNKVDNASDVLKFSDNIDNIASTFKNGRFKTVTLKPGTRLSRAFDAGNPKSNPIDIWTTRGRTADRITSTKVAISELALKGARPNRLAALEVTRPVQVRMGLIEGGGKNAFQYVFNKADLDALKELPGLGRILQ